MVKPLVTTRILRRLLESGARSRVERLVERVHPADLGPILSDLRPDEIRTVMDLLFQQRRAGRTLIELPSEMLPGIFEAMGDHRLAEVLSHLEIDDMVELAARLPEERREHILSLLSENKRTALKQMELYPEHSAGRAMTTRFLALDEAMTAQEAIDRVRAGGDDTEALTYLYVTDEQRHLKGVVPIRRLVAAPPGKVCGEFMISDPVSVRAEADQEEAAQLVARYNLLAIPVVDAEKHLLGLITVDDVIEVITEEATEDIYHLAGLSEEDRIFSPARTALRKRLPWMFLNLGATFLAAGVVGLFQHTLQQIVILAMFMPVVANMAGNVGIQSLTVITRAIALGELEFSTGLRAIGKQVSVGLMLGLAAGVVAGAGAWLWRGSPYLGLVLFVAMVLTMAIGGILGAAIPLALKALRQDPALGSGVIVTTLTDICSFFSFLGIATLLLNRLL